MSAPGRLTCLGRPGLYLGIFYFVYFSYIGAVGAYFPLWLAKRDYSAANIALILTLPQLLRIGSPQLWAHLAERYGRVSALVTIGAVIGAVAWAALALAANTIQILLSVGVIAISTLGVLPLVEAMTLASFKEWPGGYGRVRLWGSVGSIVAVLGVGALLDAYSTGLLWLIVLAVLLGLVGVSCALPDWTPAKAPHVPSPDLHKGIYRLDIIMLFAPCFFMMMAHGAFFTFFSLYLDSFGYSKLEIGILSGLSVVAEIAAFAAMPWAFRNFGDRSILFTSFGAATFRFAAIALGASSFVVVAIAQILHALTFGSFHVTSLKMVHRQFGAKLEIRGQAIYASLVYGLGGVCGGLLGGLFWRLGGGMAVFLLSAGFGAVGAIIVGFRPNSMLDDSTV